MDITRKIESFTNRLRIRHTAFTHQHLMKKEDHPMCAIYDMPLILKYTIPECRAYKKERYKMKIPRISLKTLNPRSIQKLIFFVNLFNLITFL